MQVIDIDFAFSSELDLISGLFRKLLLLCGMEGILTSLEILLDIISSHFITYGKNIIYEPLLEVFNF